MDYIMGIDVGTSNVKAVLFDEKGTEIQVASRVSETINDGGNNEEQDMTLVWEKVKACITECGYGMKQCVPYAPERPEILQKNRQQNRCTQQLNNQSGL